LVESVSTRSLGMDQGNGYPLKTTGEIDSWDLIDEAKTDEDTGMKMLGWSFIELYDSDKKLLEGTWKVPIYMPPTQTDIEIKKFQSSAIRIPKTCVYMRVNEPNQKEGGENEERAQLEKCDILYSNFYKVPEIHKFPCQYAITTPGRDPDYHNPGLKIWVHSAIGFFPERKVRIAWCIQIGKHIL